jgi:plasmid stabilization system protein ParE
MKTRFAKRALNDVDCLLAHVATQSANVAAKMEAAIGARVVRLAEQPLTGSPTDRRGIYRHPIKNVVWLFSTVSDHASKNLKSSVSFAENE